MPFIVISGYDEIAVNGIKTWSPIVGENETREVSICHQKRVTNRFPQSKEPGT